ncbi:MAG: DUF547 domain-containing protein, partial [Flavobacteriales bacterium]
VMLPNESHGYRAKESIMHMLWEMDTWLEKHVKNGLVDYKTIKASPAELNQLLNQFNRTPLLKGDAEKALLINAYNIFVIKAVVDNYPAESPLKIDGFFDKKTFNLRGKKVTLNQVEKEMLYKQFPDARLHFALVCAAVGCPKLASHAYVSDNLDAQLQDQTRAVINDPTFIHSAGATVQVSKIFEWYAADFGGKEKVIPFIQKYLLKKIRLNPKYSFYEYDWTLNELK